MNIIIQEMLDKYSLENVYEKKNAIKEIMQEIVLYGLSKAGFFKDAAFYGGTALRIFYGLDRFSEALDFSLLISNPSFDLASYFPILQTSIESFGLSVQIELKEKNVTSDVKSAFLKGDTIEHFLLFFPKDEIHGINKNEKIKIKFEIDTNPPALASYETRYPLQPLPYEIKLYNKESLFSRKIHAVLCRSWKSRVKGRDLYDYIFYLSKGIAFNLPHLKERLLQTGFINEDQPCSLLDVKNMLIQKFHHIDFEEAKRDVEPFIRDTSALDIWSKEFFISITENLKEK